MNMNPENEIRVHKILQHLEDNGWKIIKVDCGGEGAYVFEIEGCNAYCRIKKAFKEINSVDYSVVYVRNEAVKATSWVLLIISNDEDMLSDNGAKIDSLFDDLYEF